VVLIPGVPRPVFLLSPSTVHGLYLFPGKPIKNVTAMPHSRLTAQATCPYVISLLRHKGAHWKSIEYNCACFILSNAIVHICAGQL
jgi:hypothetical protein